MIRAKSEFGATQIRPELEAHGHSSQHLAFSCVVTSLRGPKGVTAVSDDTLHIILDLTQDTTQTKITGVSVQNVLTGLRRKSQYRSMDEGFSPSVESCRTYRFPNKCNILPRQGHQRCRDVSEIRHKPPVIADKAQELANTLEAIRNRP